VAIKGFNSVNIQNNVPFNNDPGQVIKPGDMLYWNAQYQAFEVGPPVQVPRNTSALYNDANFITKPELDQILANWTMQGTLDLSTYVTDSELYSAIAGITGNNFSGDYNDLTNKPVIPDTYSKTEVDTKIAAMQSFTGDYNDLLNQPVLFSGSYNDLTDVPEAFSGDYNDLLNRPDLSVYATTTYVDEQIAANKFSGDYNDLANKPTIPTVPTDLSEFTDLTGLIPTNTDNQTLTLSGKTLSISGGNAVDLSSIAPPIDLSSYATKTYVDTEVSSIVIPTALSEFTNDTGFITSTALAPFATTAFVSNAIANIQHPTLLSEFTNDVGYVTDAGLATALNGNATQAWVQAQGYLKADRDNQELGFSNGILTISGGNSVDLRPLLDNTDAQTLSLSGNTLTIANGNSVDLSRFDTDLTGLATEAYVNMRFSQVPQFSGNYDDLTNKPNLPTDISQLTDTTGIIQAANTDSQTLTLTGKVLQISGGNSVDLSSIDTVVDLTNYATLSFVTDSIAAAQPDLSSFATETYVDDAIAATGAHFSGDYNDLINQPALFSGSYNDLTDRPELSMYATKTYVDSAIAADTHFSGDYNDLINAPALFSGNYNDLIGKPDLSVFASKTFVTDAIANATLDAHFSGDYNDLTNTPLLFSGNYSELIGTPDLTVFATTDFVSDAIANLGEHFSGDYNDLINKPTIFSGLYADLVGKPDISVFATTTYVDDKFDAINAPDLSIYATTTFVNDAIAATGAHFSGDYNDLTNKPDLFSGNYADLINRPDLTTYATKTYVDDKIDAIPATDLSGYATTSYVDNSVSTILANGGSFSGDYNDLINKPDLFSGNYADLINRPDLTTYATKTYVDDKFAQVSHPTDLSEFNNDTGYITSAALTDYVTVDWLQSQGFLTTDSDNQELGFSNGILTIGNGNSVDLTPLLDNTDTQTLTYENGTLSISNGNSVNLTDLTPDLTGYATETFVTNAIDAVEHPTSLSQFINDVGYIKNLDLSGYATEDWVNAQGFIRFDSDDQMLGFANGILSIGEGNQVDLTPLLDNTDFQTLSLEGTTLSIANGNSVDLSNLVGTGTGNVDLSNYATIDYVDQALTDIGVHFSGDYNDLINKPTLFSGNYADLTGKPVIPSILGLASEEYVDDRWAEPIITGERTFTDGIVFEDFVQQRVSTVNAEAVKRDLVLAVQTTNDIETEVLFSDSSRVAIAAGTTAMFKATVVASGATGKTAFIVKGVIDYTGAGISIVGNNIVETISDSDLGWTADFTADSINSALKITVTGSPATIVDWTVFLEISEVIR